MKGSETMTKIEKEKIRNKEIAKLSKILKNLPENKQSMSEGLKQQAAFMVSTLAELQEILDNDGAIELFEQGAQRMLREHPAAKTYNAMIKNYNSTMKQLFDLLPDSEKNAQTATEDERKFLEFIKGGRH